MALVQTFVSKLAFLNFFAIIGQHHETEILIKPVIPINSSVKSDMITTQVSNIEDW